MEYTPINLEQKLSKFDEHWSPRVVAEMNDYQFKLVTVQGYRRSVYYDRRRARYRV